MAIGYISSKITKNVKRWASTNFTQLLESRVLSIGDMQTAKAMTSHRSGGSLEGTKKPSFPLSKTTCFANKKFKPPSYIDGLKFKAPKFMVKLGMVDCCFTNLTIIPKLPAVAMPGASRWRCQSSQAPPRHKSWWNVVKVIPKIYILGVSDGFWLV